MSQNEGDRVEGHQSGEQHGLHRVGGAGPRDAGVRPAAAAQQDRLPREYYLHYTSNINLSEMVRK